MRKSLIVFDKDKTESQLSKELDKKCLLKFPAWLQYAVAINVEGRLRSS
jgi:hypothetical protein